MDCVWRKPLTSLKSSMASNVNQMSLLFVVLCFLSASNTVSRSSTSCPCSKHSECDSIQKIYEQELYGFVGGGTSAISNTTNYNWTYITALAVKYAQVDEPGMDDLMCTAHKNGARMIYWMDADTIIFSDDNNSL